MENGLQGGVQIVKTPEEVEKMTSKMVGNTLITKQSGKAGFPCKAVYIVEKIKIAKEMYLSITLDRKAGCAVIIYSPAGGMSIEDVAAKSPEKIFKLPFNLYKKLDTAELYKAAKNLGIEDHKE